MQTLRRILTYLKPYWWQFAGGILLMMIAQPLQVVVPLFWKFTVDEVLISDQPKYIELFRNSRFGLLEGVLGVMFLTQALGSVISALRSYILGIISHRIGYDMRTDLYRRMQEHSLRFFHDSRSGDLVARASGDVERTTRLLTNGPDTIIASSMQLLLVWGIIAYLSWQVALGLLIPMAAVGIMMWRFNMHVRPIYRAARDRLGDVSAKLQENLLGMAVIKAFVNEPFEQEKVEHECREYYDKSVEGLTARTKFMPAVQIVGFTSNVVMLGVGAYFYLTGSFTLGGLIALRGYWWRLFQPIWSLARVNDMIQRSIASADRVFEIMDKPLEIEDSPEPVELEHVEGRITFENARFAYREDHPEVLSELNVRVEPGQLLGIAGPSGAGKSTLLWLLMRFYDPQSGRILIDGHDLRDVSQASLRSQMALVTQDPFLFNVTIRENLLFGRLDATDEAIFEAARQANAHDFILDLPDGYDTVVGERGVKLSGGQKQRICIARAFLANPRILLLDEATAAVEPESESLIQAAIERLMVGRTSVVVSHRLSMVRGAQQIVVIEDGRISERGTHDQLMVADGWYARMYRMQMGEK